MARSRKHKGLVIKGGHMGGKKGRKKDSRKRKGGRRKR